MKVISFVSEGFIPLFQAWDAISGRVLGGDVEIHCMDSRSFSRVAEALAEGQAQSRPLYTATGGGAAGAESGDRATFVTSRFAILRQENRSRAFVHSDLNAFWVRDLRPVFREHPADLIFSCESEVAAAGDEPWGFTLCCGLFAARRSVASAAFFDAWWKDVLALGDDQKALNHFLRAKDIRWRDSGYPGLLKEGEVEVSGCKVRIAALGQDQVRRQPPMRESGEAAAVFHPAFEKLHLDSYAALYRFLASREDVFLPDGYLAARKALEAVLGPRRTWDLAMLDYALSATPEVAPEWLAHRAWLLHLAGCGEAGAPDIRAALNGSPAQGLSTALTGLMIGNTVGDRALVAQCAGAVASGIGLHHPHFSDAIDGLRQARQYQLLLGMFPLLLRGALRRLPFSPE